MTADMDMIAARIKGRLDIENEREAIYSELNAMADEASQNKGEPRDYVTDIRKLAARIINLPLGD